MVEWTGYLSFAEINLIDGETGRKTDTVNHLATPTVRDHADIFLHEELEIFLKFSNSLL